MSIILSNQAREKVRQLFEMTAKAYGGRVGEQYSATPTVAQVLNDKIVEDGNPFLSRVATVAVSEITGEKIPMSVSGLVATRTDTSGSAERVARQLVGLDTVPYMLYKTDNDVAIKYSLIDVWAKFADFRARYQRLVRQAIGNDRLRIGWHGVSADADTDPVANPLGEDVNIGWLKQIRDYNSGSQVVGSAGSPVPFGPGAADFKNLDALVHDAIGLIETPFQEDPNLVVIMSRDIYMAAKGFLYDAEGATPTEKDKLSAAFQSFGGLAPYIGPFMPAGTLLVTSFDNLAIYYQDTSWRRQQIDNPKKDQYEDFNTRNEGYVVNQRGKCALIEFIELTPVTP